MSIVSFTISEFKRIGGAKLSLSFELGNSVSSVTEDMSITFHHFVDFITIND